MRVVIVLVALSIALVACALVARRSKKPIASDVAILLGALVPPMIGNLLIILSGDWLVSRIGSYVYFIGLDLTIVALLRFTTDYCGVRYRGTIGRIVLLALIVIDIVQLLANPFTGHAFTTTQIMVEGAPYFSLVPYFGQIFHRVVVYGIFFISLGIFVYTTVKSPSIYFERYLIILIVMVFTGAWESFYIFSGSPIDRSMIGFGVFGLLVFYFALYHKPMLLRDRMLASVVGELSEGVFFFDRENTCIYANPSGARLFGVRDEESLEACSEKLIDIVGSETFNLEHEWACRRAVRNVAKAGVAPQWEAGLDADNPFEEHPENRFWLLSFHLLEDKHGRPIGSFISVRDRTDEETKLRHERFIASRDSLTGLYNQAYLYEMARQRITENPDVRYCVVGIDIREFKLVNDVFNRQFGDDVLRAIARKMREHATPHEVYGRISGDKFGYVLPVDEFDAEQMERHLAEDASIAQSVNHSILIHAGVYEVNDPKLPVSVMFDRAFMAISSIKNDYRRHVVRYDDDMRDVAIWNQRISAELDDALEQGQIRPYLQPMVNAEGAVEGAEVLVRWIHPEEGALSPMRFVPHFEENGHIAQLDLFMWESACRILADWRDAGIDLFLSVNISPRDFFFFDVHQTIVELVERYGIDPAKLRLEITETVMMNDATNRLRVIEDLRASGFLVEMDDFGSGYSSLNMLKDIPVDVLKIDMMFLFKTKDQFKAETILQTIINLSERLGMISVTEGVENAEQYDMLVRMGCSLFQGFYFSKPIPREDFEARFCPA